MHVQDFFMTPCEIALEEDAKMMRIYNHLDHIDFLTIVYEDYCTKHSLPYVSADEQDLNELDCKHVSWLHSFNRMWELAQDN